MELQGIHLSNLPKGGHFSFHEALITRLSTSGEAVLSLLGTKYEEYVCCFEREDEAFLSVRKSYITDDMVEIDKERNTLMRAIRMQVKSWLLFDDEEYRTSAIVLNQDLKDVAFSPRMQLERKTGVLAKLFLLWDDEEHAVHVNKLGITPLFVRLKEKNEKWRQLSEERTQETLTRNEKNFNRCRLETDAAYRAIVSIIRAHLMLGETEVLEGLVGWMNAQITHYKQQIINPRQGRRKKKEEAVAEVLSTSLL